MLKPIALITLITMGVVVSTGCATPFEVVQLPLRDAQLYPVSQTRGDITVAVDAIDNPARAQKYFGVNLIKMGILPVNITVSNHSGHTYSVQPADILLRRHTEVIDPLPIEQVTRLAKQQSGHSGEETHKQIEDYFNQLTFAGTVISAHDSYQGVLFFPAGQEPDREDSLFRAIMLFRQGNLRLDVVATDLQTQDRTEFGPFPVNETPRWTAAL